MNSLENHPSQWLALYRELGASELGDDFRFAFSRYVYVPQAISEKREAFEAPAPECLSHFERARSSLKEREEIAFHSLIQSTRGSRHIPFLDMSCERIEDHIENLRPAFLDFGIQNFSVFQSGRSFHIYGHGLLRDQNELIRFMGRLLLLNLPKQERVIDERWVGHRLMAGYLTLRWTNNNPHYRMMPKLLKTY